MMKGMNAWKRRHGIVKRAMENSPEATRRVLTDYAENVWKKRALEIAPEDTGAYKAGLDYEVQDRQLILKATAPHSLVVDEGSANHAAQPTVVPAFEQTRRAIPDMLRAALKEQMK